MSQLESKITHSDQLSSKIGMWLFLFTEIIFFGGMFLLYAIFRSRYQEDFHFCASTLNSFLGTINTMVLLSSSLSMVLAVQNAFNGKRKSSLIWLFITILAGCFFLCIKAVEWHHKIEAGLYPNSEILLQHPSGENIFYSLYFAMTGLHALHVIIGIGILLFMSFFLIRRPRLNLKLADHKIASISLNDEGKNKIKDLILAENEKADAVILLYKPSEMSVRGHKIKIENSGLYWHLIDIIWIFLFPLFYLIS